LEVRLPDRGTSVRRLSVAALSFVAILVMGFCEPFLVRCQAPGGSPVTWMSLAPCPSAGQGDADCGVCPTPTGAGGAGDVSLAPGSGATCCDRVPLLLSLTTSHSSRGDEATAAVIPQGLDPLPNDPPVDPRGPAGPSTVPIERRVPRSSILLL
jgi:hypothetical protein